MKTIQYKKIWAYYWRHLRNYKKYIFVVFLAYSAGPLIGDIALPLIYKNIIDLISNTQDRPSVQEDLVFLVILLGIFLAVRDVFFRIADRAWRISETSTLRDLSNYTFSKIQAHSYRFFTNNFTGSLVAKAKRFLSAFEDLYMLIVFNFWWSALKLIGIIGVLFWIVPSIAFLFIIWLLVYVGSTFVFIKKRMRYDLAEANADSKVTSRLSDVITNILNLKMFATQKREEISFSKITQDQMKKTNQSWRSINLQFAIQSSLIALLEFLGMFVVIKLWINNEVSTGTVVLVQIYLGNIFNTVWQLVHTFTRVAKNFADAKEMVDIFEKKPGVKDPQDPEECKIEKGEIEIKNISFEYENKISVFHNFSLKIKPGEKVGIVGTSGVGKTTISKLLLRFLDLQKGQILIDGQDISQLRQNDLRQKIAYVPQDPILFHRTLKENIAYANSLSSQEEIIKAVKKAYAHRFISLFPKKYNTLVGERGIKLSGGERQRVAIARAMLKKAPILILDEATSSLDSVSEKYIQKALGELMKNKTTLVIAHRLSTIQKMDRILVLDQSGIVEEGTHLSLLKKKGAYFKFWKEQTDEFIN